ncbi:thermonuclease family protein [Rhodospira trueperi]|uniref:Endonuclease YncB, thermonuclease family n=1 Tax=Rhodospira trueperi TaxID=69960 RepID=A0A1G7E4P1_9PROT|nr:thermonuclease family protein [Rhodospira trueperi]SDE58436.1 Endonuclease YncB, thermonuclease family [Rhodospira trueperi]
MGPRPDTAVPAGSEPERRPARDAVRAVGCAVLLLVGGSATPAQADAAGSACIEDGDTLHIDGRRAYGKCRGGQEVVLYGIDAPELEQTCLHDAREWPCGLQAASTLLRLTLDRTVTCEGNSWNRDGALIAVCHVDDVELNHTMVRLGLAVSDGTRYAREEGAARAEHAGMWIGTFERPAEWRAAH